MTPPNNEMVKELREKWLNPGDEVYTLVTHVSRSGMQRVIRVFVIREGNYNKVKETLKLKEVVATEGAGEGVVIYRLEHVEKILKGAKKGSIRIGEDVPLKVSRRIGKNSKAVAFVAHVAEEAIKAGIQEEAGIKAPSTEEVKSGGEDNQAVEEAIAKEAVKLTEEMKDEEINGPLEYKDWTVIKEGIVENSQAPNYKSGVKLEQNRSFFIIIVNGCYPQGYTSKEEAVKKYEWLTEVW